MTNKFTGSPHRAALAYGAVLDGLCWPSGHADDHGVWRPSASEWRYCCLEAESALHFNASALREHCQGSIHNAAVCDVDPVALWAALQLLYWAGEWGGRGLPPLMRRRWDKEKLNHAKLGIDDYQSALVRLGLQALM